MPADDIHALRRPVRTLEHVDRFSGHGLRRGAARTIARPKSAQPTASADNDDPAGAGWTLGMPDTIRLVRRNVRRRFVHALDVANAAKDLGDLPAAGESVHVIMRGNWHAWDLVPAILRLADGASIARLYVATLGFNKDNARELGELIDAGRIRAVRFVCSVYFRDTTRDVHDYLAELLQERGQALLAMRNHAKVLAMLLDDGRALVVESSANLRSCRNVEQFALSQDRQLFDFHAGWIDDQVNRGGRHR